MMRLKLAFFLLSVSILLEAKIDLRFSLPDISIPINHTLNLLTNGDIKDKDTGYIFAVGDLNLNRVNYNANIKNGIKTIEVYAQVRCNIKYVIPGEDASEYLNYYWFINIIYDLQGNIKHVLPVITDRNCTNQLLKFNKLKTHKNITVDFDNVIDFDILKTEKIVKYVNKLIHAGKILIKNHTFNLNELEVSSVGFAVYEQSQQMILEVEANVKCDIIYRIHENIGLTSVYNHIVMHINPENEKLNSYEMLGPKRGVECK